MPTLEEVRSRAGFESAFDVVNEYERSLAGLTCSARIEQSVDDLQTAFTAPSGRLLVAVDEDAGRVAGCIAMRPHNAILCEMYRLYVRPAYRGQGLGRQLATRLIEVARADGYRTMRLHTITALDSAIRLYRGLGFSDVEPYETPADDDQVFLAIDLNQV